jgi:hypothetical protein
VSARSRRARRVVAAAFLIAATLAGQGVGLADNTVSGNRHWSDGDNPRGYVMISDFTPSAWPVVAASNEWGTEPNLDVFYDFEGCGGMNHCVDVRDVNMQPNCTGAGGSGGYAILLPTSGHLSGDDSKVRVNNDCEGGQYDNRDRRALLCEELGHIMGLDHAASNLNNETCMASGAITQLHEHPRDHDFNMLHNVVYDHND